MSSQEEREEFNKRAAEVFGALDSHTPKYISTHGSRGLQYMPHDSNEHHHGDSQRKRQRSPPDNSSLAEPPPWQVTLAEPGQSDQTSSKRQQRQSSRHHVTHLTKARGHQSLRSRPARPHRVPSYLTHPDQWTRYSLSDDGTKELQDYSDEQVNRHAAFQFLSELKKRKTSKDVTESTNDSIPNPDSITGSIPSKIEFRKPKARMKSTKPSHCHSRVGETNGAGSSNQPSSPIPTKHDDHTGENTDLGHPGGHGVIRMPEYIVGGEKACRQRTN